jgi:2-polyprenyl-6-hydroxyphenyl methylase/3-demethylubiquinone-9 3-methyltransferase
MTAPARNADPAELERFNSLASRWWDTRGEMRLLHRMNPVRVGFMKERASIDGARCLDVGCGAGILCEALAREGAEVHGIDLAPDSLAVARLHQRESGLDRIGYRQVSAEELVAEEAGRYDIVTCLEMLEHVPDPASVIAACARLVRPGGDVFFSTINRSARAFALAILGAEYLLALLPRGTHDFMRFVRPSELDGWARAAGLSLTDIAGLSLPPGSDEFHVGSNVDVNYIAHFRRLA